MNKSANPFDAAIKKLNSFLDERFEMTMNHTNDVPLDICTDIIRELEQEMNYSLVETNY